MSGGLGIRLKVSGNKTVSKLTEGLSLVDARV